MENIFFEHIAVIYAIVYLEYIGVPNSNTL